MRCAPRWREVARERWREARRLCRPWRHVVRRVQSLTSYAAWHAAAPMRLTLRSGADRGTGCGRSPCGGQVSTAQMAMARATAARAIQWQRMRRRVKNAAKNGHNLKHTHMLLQRRTFFTHTTRDESRQKGLPHELCDVRLEARQGGRFGFGVFSGWQCGVWCG